MEKYIRGHDNAQIFYISLPGERKKPTLVFVHSIGANWTVWKTEISYFHRLGYPCIAFDLRSHGLSEVVTSTEAYSFPNFSHDLRKILDAEKVKKFILMGHSFGGGVAITYCGLYPKKLPLKLILVETAHRYPWAHHHELNMNPYIAMLLRFLAEHQRFTNAHLPHLRELDFSTEFHRKQRTKLGVFLEALHVTPLKSILKCIDQLQKWSFEHLQDTEKVLQSLRIPVLIVSGSEDLVVPLQFQEELHHLIKKSQLRVIMGAYHRIPTQNPEELCHLVQQFLEEKK